MVPAVPFAEPAGSMFVAIIFLGEEYLVKVNKTAFADQRPAFLRDAGIREICPSPYIRPESTFC